ncbi:MAG TPA: gephyrin-like molybdotransferase receptor GlpR, partial [Mycobacterium sp.]|nr:gephyrin-like molybdotransferase receptor GlpR [Mycobacterium sp.]
MPSIPQSLLWISLVVLWLFVLVPMLISKRDTVRRTSDVALATRVLNTGRRARLLRRSGPAAGHYSDPDWRPSEDDLDGDLEEDVDDHEVAPARRAVVLAAAIVQTEPDYLDVDIVEEDAGALPVGASAAPPVEELPDPVLPLDFDDSTQTFSVDDLSEVDEVDEVDEPEPEPEAEVDEPEVEAEPDGTTDVFEALDDGTDYDYEYVDDSSGLEAASEADLHVADSMSAARRQRYESKTAAAVSARKYRFRKRMLMTLTVLLAGSAAAAFMVSPTFWWACGSIGAFTVLYLGYLRRQTRIEEHLRRRRAQRMMRSRLGVESTQDSEFDVVPSRLRRPGAVVLEIDDEDP